MEDTNQPAVEKKSMCGKMSFCCCKAFLAALIIVFVWWWTPSWANIAITVLAALIIIGSGTCGCKKNKNC
ncbi:hypothetical protein HOE31_00645 [bacterium]|jgi:hypothetical protein|nr:hypothetical protein [bacterium]MBT4335028.1 hypothetical protein [bacterium]MBT4495648.1 hypothetical protein [bacterium]MBT4764124.1 hypothetical protein [bacterium]MBT5401496.1 hypothetical protein [bacterium]